MNYEGVLGEFDLIRGVLGLLKMIDVMRVIFIRNQYADKSICVWRKMSEVELSTR